jgi:methyl-accepting chemotaxis protein
MKIKYKLISLVSVALAALFLVLGIGIKNSTESDRVLNSFQDHTLVSIEAILNVRVFMNAVVMRGYEMNSKQSYEDPNYLLAEIKRLRALKEDAETGLQNAVAQFEAAGVSPNTLPIWNEFKAVFAPWFSVLGPQTNVQIDQVLSKSNPTRQDMDAMLFKIEEMMVGQRDNTAKIWERVIKLVEMKVEETNTDVEASLASSAQSMRLQIIVGVLALFALGGLGWATIRAITQPLNKVRDVVQQVGRDRNFVLRTNHNSKDEIGEMTQAFDNMLSDLQTAFRDIQERNEKVGQAAASMATAAQQVASSSSSQSSSTSAMAASVEEMTVSINTVSGSASEAQAMAQHAGAVSTEGAEIIARTSDEMGTIAKIVGTASGVIAALGEEAKQISSVVQVIKEVADQTNLLALNAAIEAARAGDQGRGFAVVADEVRKLAERTTQSTSDISSIIGKIQVSAQEAVTEMGNVVAQVESGQVMAHEAGTRIHSILDEATKVSEAVTEISCALKEQSQASQEIARHVESVAQTTDENNAAAEGAASGAQNLNQLALEIKGVLAQFKV